MTSDLHKPPALDRSCEPGIPPAPLDRASHRCGYNRRTAPGSPFGPPPNSACLDAGTGGPPQPTDHCYHGNESSGHVYNMAPHGSPVPPSGRCGGTGHSGIGSQTAIMPGYQLRLNMLRIGLGAASSTLSAGAGSVMPEQILSSIQVGTALETIRKVLALAFA